MQTEREERKKSDLIAEIEDLNIKVDQLTKAFDAFKHEIAKMQVQTASAGVDREERTRIR